MKTTFKSGILHTYSFCAAEPLEQNVPSLLSYSQQALIGGGGRLCVKTLSNIPCTAHQTEFKARAVSQCTQSKERSPLVYEIFSTCVGKKYFPLVAEIFKFTCVSWGVVHTMLLICMDFVSDVIHVVSCQI